MSTQTMSPIEDLKFSCNDNLDNANIPSNLAKLESPYEKANKLDPMTMKLTV